MTVLTTTLHISNSDSIIHFVRETPPLLLPLFRSANQARLLSAVFLGHDPQSLSELAKVLAIPYSTVHRETAQLLDAGILVERRVGNTRLLEPNTASPFHGPLRELLEIAFGPVPLLKAAFEHISGVEAAAIFGSWAHRTLGRPGAPPADIDVLVVGTPDPAKIYDACSRVGATLRRPVNPTILTSHEWNQRTPFLDEVRRGGLLAIAGDLDEDSKE